MVLVLQNIDRIRQVNCPVLVMHVSLIKELLLNLILYDLQYQLIHASYPDSSRINIKLSFQLMKCRNKVMCVVILKFLYMEEKSVLCAENMLCL